MKLKMGIKTARDTRGKSAGKRQKGGEETELTELTERALKMEINSSLENDSSLMS